MDTPRFTRPGEGLTFTTTPTDTMEFLCPGDDTMPDVIVERLAPGDGPPLHSHPFATWEVVVRGRVRFKVGDQTADLDAGSFAYTPPNAVHSFMALGDEDAKVVQFNWPGGFHVAYADIAGAFEGGAPDPAALGQVAAKHGITLHGPPLAVTEPEGM